MTKDMLYKLYIRELSLYSETLRSYSDEDIEKQYETVSEFKDLTWVDIYDGIEKAGFIMVTDCDHSAPNYDYYIMETYVHPNHRKKGLASNALLNFVNKHPGSYGLHILKGNIDAIAFWNEFFKRPEVKQIEARSKMEVPEQCFEAGFVTSSEFHE